ESSLRRRLVRRSASPIFSSSRFAALVFDVEKDPPAYYGHLPRVKPFSGLALFGWGRRGVRYHRRRAGHPLAHRLDDDVQHRNEDDVQERGQDHAAGDRRADGVPRLLAGARREDERQDAENE